MNQHGFSLTEVLIATAISSLLLISASRFLPGLQRAVLLQSGQREVEEPFTPAAGICAISA